MVTQICKKKWWTLEMGSKYVSKYMYFLLILLIFKKNKIL